MSKMLSSQTLYYGPSSSSYNSNGSVSKDQTVTAIWKEGSWLHIEFTSGSKLKRGFVPTSSVNLTETVNSITNSRLVRYVSDDGSTYDGPGTNYTVGAALPKGKKVWFVGQKPHNYACIEYSIGANDNTNKIRVYMTTAKLSDSFTISNYQTFTKGNTIPSGYHFAGASVSQGFNDTTTRLKGHLGYDLTGFSTVTPVFDGTIKSVTNSNNGPNGRVVIVQHSLNGYTCYSAYCHLASIPSSIKDGVTVTTNTQIGVMGGSGNGSDSCYDTHLHLAIFKDGTTSSPNGYCISGGSKRFEEVAQNYANPYYYGPNTTNFPRCGSVKFYDPYGVITSKGAVFAKC